MKLDKSRNTRQSRSTELTALLRDLKGESKKRFDRSLTLLVGLAIATTLAAQTTMPARAGQNGQERRAENAAQGNKNQAQQQQQQQQQQQRNRNRAAKDTRQDNRANNRQAQLQAQNQAQAENQASRQAQARANRDAINRADAIRAQRKENVRDDRRNIQATNELRTDNRWNQHENRNNNPSPRAYHRPENRWDSSLDNKARYQAYKRYRNNWGDQRNYLNANLKRFNQLAALERQQQVALDSQMQAAYFAYNNNNYSGAYTWDNYSNPQFLDYLQRSRPSLLQSLLSGLGLGGNDNYLYSSDWRDERSQLSQNMSNIHQLAASGRITSMQEQSLIDQMRPEFMTYRNNQYAGNPTWSQYSEPGFVDYLNNNKPSVLSTVRDYLII